MATGIKTGGRAKGTPNRTTTETKALLQSIISEEIDNLAEMLDKLEPLERVNAVAKLLPYILPKQSEVKAEISAEINNKIYDLSKLSDATLEELSNAYN